MSSPVIATDSISRRFGDVVAVREVSLDVPRAAIYLSLAFHLALPVGFLIVKGLDKLGLHLFSDKKTVNLKEMYQSYIQVDVVALPDQLMNERTNIDTTAPIVDKTETKPVVEENKQDPTTMTDPEEAAKAEAVKKEAEMAEKKKAEEKKKQAEAEKAAKEKKDAEKAKKEALKKAQQEADREAALKGLAKDGKKGRQKLSGNKLSKGTAMSGNIGTAKEAYTASVAQKIREHFNIFPWQKKKNLVTVVYIEINPNGRLKSKKLMKGSKDSVYDAAVLQAIEESQPLPIPEDMSLVADGLTLEFKPEN